MLLGLKNRTPIIPNIGRIESIDKRNKRFSKRMNCIHRYKTHIKHPNIWYKLMLPLQKLISSIKTDFMAGIESR